MSYVAHICFFIILIILFIQDDKIHRFSSCTFRFFFNYYCFFCSWVHNHQTGLARQNVIFIFNAHAILLNAAVLWDFFSLFTYGA